MFVNFTNHPSNQWDDNQIRAAHIYGESVDVPFPEVDPTADEDYITSLADTCMKEILKHHPTAVLCQGEFCLAYQVISRCKALGIPVLAACSKRCVEENGNRKIVTFSFARFRRYE